MARSETDICNIAFDALREPPTPDIDNPGLPVHRGARQQFERARTYVLEQREWQIARTQVEIAALADPRIHGQLQDEFPGYFQLPGDFVKLVALKNCTRWGQRSSGDVLWLGADAAGPLTIVYVRRIAPSEMTEALATAIGLRMAWQIAPAHSKDRTAKNDIKGDYLSAYQTAMLADNAMRSPQEGWRSPWLDAMSRA